MPGWRRGYRPPSETRCRFQFLDFARSTSGRHLETLCGAFLWLGKTKRERCHVMVFLVATLASLGLPVNSGGQGSSQSGMTHILLRLRNPELKILRIFFGACENNAWLPSIYHYKFVSHFGHVFSLVASRNLLCFHSRETASRPSSP